MASCVFLSSLASFLSISRFRSQFALLGAILKRSYSRVSSIHTDEGDNKSTNQLLGSFLSILLDDLFSQPLYVLLQSVFHFYVFVVSSLFERSRLRVEIPVLNERFCISGSAVVRKQNRSNLFDLLTHPPLFLLPYASVERGGEPCELPHSLPKTLRHPESCNRIDSPAPLRKGCQDHVNIEPIIGALVL